jgi:pimeloyl-ACP methyl ester carboxylesterase
MPIEHVGEIELYYETYGSGAPLLLIAGLNTDHGLFRTLVPRLATHYRVVVFDNRGIGRSTGADTPFTMETLADDAAGLLHALGIARAHVLGVSLGGRIAAALALRHPALPQSLILVSTTMEPPPPSWHQRWVGLLLRLPMIRHGSPYAVVARQRAASRAFNCTERLAEIRVPTLIMHGRRDALAPADLVRRMQAGIPGAQLATFNGGHLFFLLRAQRFLETLGAFLERSQAPAAAPGD